MSSFRRQAPIYAVLAIMLAMTGGLWLAAREITLAHNHLRFEQSAQAFQEAIENRIKNYVEGLLGLRGLFAASPSVQRQDWEKFVVSVEMHRRYPGIRALGFAERVAHPQKEAHQRQVQQEGFPDYQVRPPGDRPVYFPVVYLTRFDTNLSPELGWDQYSEPVRRQALDLARDTGRPLATVRIRLLASEAVEQRPVFLMYVPVYRHGMPVNTPAERQAALRGFIIGQYIPDLLLANVFSELAYPHLDVEVFDGRALEAQSLLHDLDQVLHGGQTTPRPPFGRRVEIPVLNHVWTLYFTPKPEFFSEASRYLPWLALLGGLLVSVLLFGITRTQVKARLAAEQFSATLRASEEALRAANEQLKQQIQEREAAEAQLRLSEAFYQSLVENLPQNVFRKDLAGRFTFANQRFCALLGQPLAGLIGKTDYDFFPADLAAKYQADDEAVADSGKLFETEEDHYTPDGQRLVVQVVKSPLRDAAGNLCGIQGIFWDISARKKAEDALEAEKEQLAVTLRSIGDGVITTDIRGAIVLMNTVAEALTGWTQAEAAGRPLGEVFVIHHEQTGERLPDPVEQVLQSGAPAGLANRTVLRARDHTERAIADSAAPILDLAGRVLGVVLVFRDVTEKRRLEAELLRASKLESIGLLAGGIAHDFNNVLTVIMGHLSMAAMFPDSPAKVAESVQKAEKALQRAKEITQQLLTFAKGGAPIKKPVPLDQLLRNAAQIACRGSNVRCAFDVPEGLPWVDADEAQLGQAIQNLIFFAVQAMPEGGRVEVAAAKVSVAKAALPPLPAGDYVRVTITDQGRGLEYEHLPKIFDPYFAFKTSGIGLGLATAHSVVRRHGGQIGAHSVLGRGTTFTIHLPVAAAAPPPPPTVETPMAQPAGGRVLVMDDEEEIGNLARLTLQRQGFEVEVARDGAEAIARFLTARQMGRPFAVVVLDLTIQNGMGGKETVQRLREVDPDIVAIVSSGYSFDPVMANFREYGFKGVVPKPYRPEELVRAVRALL